MYDPSNNCALPFPLVNFKKLLKISVYGLFMIDSKLYKQIDGVSMGNPLGPTFANIFLAHLEKSFVNLPFSPKLYKRYIDDTFCVFSNHDDCNSFFNHINSVHPNLKFTMEKYTNGLAFLDTFVTVDDNNICNTTIFRKPTFTGHILNFSSCCPTNFKVGLILGYLYRAFCVCSSWALFHLEVINITNIFINNGYPINFVQNIISKFVYSKFIVRIVPVKQSYTNSLTILLWVIVR